MTRQDIEALFARRQAVYRHDVTALTTMYSDACIVESRMAGIVRGPEAVEPYMRSCSHPPGYSPGVCQLVEKRRNAIIRRMQPALNKRNQVTCLTVPIKFASRLRYGVLQMKFAASSVLPVPLYRATCGYGHRGRVRSTLPSVL
jgi:hypothetical protein